MKRLARATIVAVAALFALAVLASGAFRFLVPDLLGERLHNAARNGDIPRARVLLLFGSDINYATGIGTALHIAAIRGDTKFMEFLLQHGAAPDIPAKWQVTPLYFARTYNHPEAERLLLQHGVNPDTSHINPP
jgi:ankyrin repeat protein